MPATTNPELLIAPLAKNAEKNVIPETTGATTGLFSQDLGFQEINSTPLTAGGKAPDRKDFNGVFNLLGGVSFYAQKGWTFHYDSTQDYYLGCLVIDPADGKRYECIADMPAGTIAPHSDTDNTYWRRFTLGDGAHVGDIKAIAYNGTVQAGWLLCDGAAVSRTMYPDLFSAIGTTYGAGDGSTTFNLPDYNDAERFVQGSSTAGTVKSAGLPNITGDSGARWICNNNLTSSGALSPWVLQGENATVGSGVNAVTCGGLQFDASRSSAIYGNSTTVQPPALTARYIIKAFDGQTADSALIDVTQYASDLANKADRSLSNLTEAGKSFSFPSDTYVDISSYITMDVLGTAYIPPADGFVVLTGTPTAASNNNTIDLQAGCRVIIPCPVLGSAAVASAPVRKGDNVYMIGHGSITCAGQFFYAQGEVPNP